MILRKQGGSPLNSECSNWINEALDADPGYVRLHHNKMQANWHQYIEYLVTGDVSIVEDDWETDVEGTNEAELKAYDKVVYDSLEVLEGAIVQMVMEASLHDTSMIGSSGSQPTKEIVAQPFKVGD
uniref:Late blight resistance protein n=1 Tax=Solanum tuberosum TaxID=4113 RepID=M1DCB1_SOLTU